MTEEEKYTEERSHPLPWIVGIILLLVAVILAGLYWNRTGHIDHVKFKGNQYIATEILQKKIDIPKGIHPDSLNYDAIFKQLKEFKFVERVELKVQPGGTMVVDISERRPVALLIDQSKQCYVDSNGVKLAIESGHIPTVPILYGFNVESMGDTLQSKAFNTISKFLQNLIHHPTSNATVSAIKWSENNGVVALSTNGGVQLIFGKEHFKKRLRNWEAFYAQVVRHKGIDHFESVNMKFNKQIITHE